MLSSATEISRNGRRGPAPTVARHFFHPPSHSGAAASDGEADGGDLSLPGGQAPVHGEAGVLPGAEGRADRAVRRSIRVVQPDAGLGACVGDRERGDGDRRVPATKRVAAADGAVAAGERVRHDAAADRAEHRGGTAEWERRGILR